MPIPDENPDDSSHSVGIDAVTNEIVENEPRVREEIVEKLQGEATATDPVSAPSESPATPTNTSRQTVDSFNPEIHETNGDGTPRLTKDGKYRRKRGRKGASNPQATVIDPPTPKPSVDYRGLAAFLCTVGFSATEKALGEHWKPLPEERQQIESATAKYAESQGWDDLPPGIVLLIAVGMYAMPRIPHPETKARLSRIGQSLGIIKVKPVSPTQSTYAVMKENGIHMPNGEIRKPPFVPENTDPLSQFNKG